MTDNNTNAAALATKVAALIEQTRKRANNICKRRHVPQDVMDAYTADVTDMLQARFKGLRATTKQMAQLSKAVPQDSWSKTGNAALCFIAQYYKFVSEVLTGSPVLDRTFLHVVEDYEIQRRSGSYKEDAGALEEVQRLYYAYALLIIGELTDASAEELAELKPDGITVNEQGKTRCIAAAVGLKKQHEHRTGNNPSDKVTVYNNVANNLRKPMTATVNRRDQTLHPVLQEIQAEKQRCTRILTDPHMPEDTKQEAKAMQQYLSETAVSQVWDGAMIIAHDLRLLNNEMYAYKTMTPYQWAQKCTDQNMPNARMVTEVMYATLWLSRQRTEVTEKCVKNEKTTDVDGKTRYKPTLIDTVTSFTPLVFDIVQEFNGNIRIENATRIKIGIHRLLIEGRSGSYKEDAGAGKKKIPIKKPAKYLLPIKHFTDFGTPAERRFRSVILAVRSGKTTPAHRNEYDLLEEVFDYEARQELYNKEYEEAQQLAIKLSCDTSATEEDKAAALEKAGKANKKRSYHITNHMGADYKALCGMFEKAKKDGLITEYDRREGARIVNKKKYGYNYVWVWKHPEEQTSQ